MKKIIEQLMRSNKEKVLIIGDVMLDEYIFGEVDRISPEAPVPVVKHSKTERSLGGAANVALNCKKIGFEVQLLGVIGNDKSGEVFLSLLRSNSLPTDNILISKDRATTTKKRIMSINQQLLRVDFEDNFLMLPMERAYIYLQLSMHIPNCKIILISDYAKGVIDEQMVEYIVGLARKHNCIVLVDPKGPLFNKYKGVDFIKPNFKEFKQMCEFFGLSKEKPLVENARHICDSLNLKGLFITLGEKGMQYVSSSEAIFSPAVKKEVFDLTGAGDTVSAFLALGIINYLKIDECLKLANHAAAIAIGYLKNYAVGMEELFTARSVGSRKYIEDWILLKNEIQRLKDKNKKIIFTNGCFDLLHPGHVKYLQEAKNMGDILIVALNTDASIQRIKGMHRPIQNLESRASIMEALESVDFVTTFDEDTPKSLIELIKPDILIKGGDYKVENIVGYEFVTSYGGKVIVVNFEQGHSTTNIVSKIKELNLSSAN